MLELFLILGILALDQVSKYLTDLFLVPLGTSHPLIDGVFHLTSAHNTGAAWGVMAGGRWFFIVLTLIVTAVLVWFLLRYRKRMQIFSRVILAFLIAGAVGNLIDRALLGYVRDMFDFCLINFPVFNVADSALTVGSVLLVIDTLFSKEKALLSMNLKKDANPPESSAPGHE